MSDTKKNNSRKLQYRIVFIEVKQWQLQFKNSVQTVTGLWDGRPQDQGLSPVSDKKFVSSLQHPDWLWAHPSSRVDILSSFFRGKAD